MPDINCDVQDDLNCPKFDSVFYGWLNTLKNKVYEMCTTLPHKLVDITAAGDRIEVSENTEGGGLTVVEGTPFAKTISWDYTIPGCRPEDTHAQVFVRGQFVIDNLSFTDGGTVFSFVGSVNGRKIGGTRADEGNAGTSEEHSYSGAMLYLPIVDCKIELDATISAALGGTPSGSGSVTAANWGAFIDVDVLTTQRMA